MVGLRRATRQGFDGTSAYRMPRSLRITLLTSSAAVDFATVRPQWLGELTANAGLDRSRDHSWWLALDGGVAVATAVEKPSRSWQLMTGTDVINVAEKPCSHSMWSADSWAIGDRLSGAWCSEDPSSPAAVSRNFTALSWNWKRTGPSGRRSSWTALLEQKDGFRFLYTLPFTPKTCSGRRHSVFGYA